MKTVLSVFGTRPEAIKMCPLINELKSRDGIRSAVCVTGQHREILDGVLKAFGVIPDYDLAIMKDGQTLFDVTCHVLDRLCPVIDEVSPDVVLVHGDTTSAFAAALAAFYKRVDVAHVEAGLRTYNNADPYPEEFNRQAIGAIAKYHFAPTEWAKENLLSENKNEKNVFVTGNTVIDALRTTVRKDYTHPELEWARDSRLIIITAHRRENLGEPMERMLVAIRRVIEEADGVKAIFPIHPNPRLQRAAHSILGECERIHLIEPVDTPDFHNLLARAHLVLSDSGGIQEEATYLGIPLLVMRNKTERPEGLASGALKLIGTDGEGVYQAFRLALESCSTNSAPRTANLSYGDGSASKRIADILTKALG